MRRRKRGGGTAVFTATPKKKTRVRLEKSIVSHTAQVEEHGRKLSCPARYDSGWSEKTDRQREGLLHKWEKDLTRNAEQAQIELEVWKERFGNDDERSF